MCDASDDILVDYFDSADFCDAGDPCPDDPPADPPEDPGDDPGDDTDPDDGDGGRPPFVPLDPVPIGPSGPGF